MRLLALVALGVVAGSCAYYNTFYLARRYYDRATDGKPYEVGRTGSAQSQNYSKTIDYSKKLLANYPGSKWVDDAYLLWAKSLIGRDDPLQTITMLQDFSGSFPKSELKAEAEFYLGLAFRSARRYPAAITSFDEFLLLAPKHELVPYAYYERSLALSAMKRYGESAESASHVLEMGGKHQLHDRALRQRAEARFQQGDFAGARSDFHEIGMKAANDEERFLFFMREVDCLESGRQFDVELALLRRELASTPPPPPVQPGQLPQAGADHYGKLLMRIGTAELLAGRPQDAMREYGAVIGDYPKSALSAEAQYRMGFAYETGTDDFPRALEEYGKVKEQFGSSPFSTLAQQRADNLQRIEQYRKGTGADSLEKKAEAAFLTAELYLFQLDKPDRALEEYSKVSRDYAGHPVAGRAINAEGWVLSRKLNRKASADSAWWEVVNHYPATEAQLAARDYLELDGQVVDEHLIVPPAPPPAPPVDSTKIAPEPSLAAPPPVPAIGAGAFGPPDSARVGRFGPGGEPHPDLMNPSAPGYPGAHPPGAMYDSTGRVIDPRLAPPPVVPPPAPPRDTTAAAPPDTTAKRKADDK